MSELIAEAALSKAALHKLGSEQLKQDLQLAAIAFVGLSCYHGPWRMIRFIFTELLWFCIGCAVWQRSFRCSGLEPVKKVDDNIRMAIFISSTIGALWWGCVASGFMLALMAHCIQNWWLAFAVNTALAVAVHKAGKIKCEQKKAWVALSAEDDPPLWLLDQQQRNVSDTISNYAQVAYAQRLAALAVIHSRVYTCHYNCQLTKCQMRAAQNGSEIRNSSSSDSGQKH
eukprot:11335-Heterococcus_DN1.PRE.1